MKYTLHVVAIVIIAVFGVSYFVFNLTKEETGLCKNYPVVKGEISCKEAIKLAVSKYPGEVYSVDKIEIRKGAESWIIGITLDTPITVELKDGGNKIINTVEISVDENSNVGIYGMVGL